MNIVHWNYTRKYRIKCVFDTFPATVVLFRKITDYYFIFSMSGVDEHSLPNRNDYERMEYVLNAELGTLPAYLNRKSIMGAR